MNAIAKQSGYDQRQTDRLQRIEDENNRISRVRSLGVVPGQCGSNIIDAPARGPVKLFRDFSYDEQTDGSFKVVGKGFDGRLALRRGDVFDIMADQARRAKADEPFAPAEVAMGRYYRDLFERHASAGIKCSSVEGVGGGSGGAGGFMDAMLSDGRELDRLRGWIGSGSAMVVRRVRPSSRGSRVSIFDRRLVDMVCLEDKSISDVLKAHGWVRKGDTVKALRLGLCGVLNRMMGRHIHQKTQSCQFGSGPNMGNWA